MPGWLVAEIRLAEEQLSMPESLAAEEAARMRLMGPGRDMEPDMRLVRDMELVMCQVGEPEIFWHRTRLPVQCQIDPMV